MRNLIFSTILLGSFFSVKAQSIFSDKRPTQTKEEFTRKVNDISYDIDEIIKNNKSKLKQDLNEIEKQMERQELTKEEADKMRIEKAEFYAKRIEEESEEQENRIKELINNKIEDNIHFSSDMSAYQKKLIEKKTLGLVEWSFGQSMMVINNNDFHNVYDNRFLRSYSLGIGIGVKTRMGDEFSRFYWRPSYEVALSYFGLNDNRIIESINNQTVLVDSERELKKSAMMIYSIQLSNYIEYDFSKRKYDEFGNPIIKSRQSFFVGAGGFLGYGAVSRQILYEQDGEKYRQTTAAKFNANQFVYGVGAYVGYGSFSLKATYNINTVFKRSFADQNVFTLGIGLHIL